MLKRLVFLLILKYQYILFVTLYFFISPFVKKDRDTWVIGLEEIASVLINMAGALPKSYSVNLFQHPFYNFNYDYSINGRSAIKYIILGPLLFAYLAAKYDKFIYIGAKGFLLSMSDARELEFSFLHKKGKKIVCYFTGSEIRSFKLLNNYAKKHDLDVITTYQGYVRPELQSQSEEVYREKLARVAEKYSSVIFNPAIDQMSYFKKQTESCLYFCPEEQFQRNDAKFVNLTTIKIVHAPSSPIIKGTPLVHAAIKKLKSEGYLFEYVELIDMKHDVVIQELHDAHLVLNQFYAFIPSIFGVEALASHTVLLTSADETIEKGLVPGSNEAWHVTKYWQVYDNIKFYLDCPDKIKPQADKGFEFCYREFSVKSGARKLHSILEDI
jgi:hypothetical protein